MRRHLRALLTAALLAGGTTPLAAIEYHTQAEALPDPTIADMADPLEVVQSQDADSIAPPNEPGMIEGFYDDCCDTCCDGWCDGFYAPKSWNLRAEALWMERGEPEGNLLLTDAGGQFFGAGQLDFDVESGFDLSILEFNPAGHGWEIRYFWLNDWSQTNSMRMVDPVIATNPPTPALTGTFDVDVTYVSKLRSGEWNYLRATKYGTIIAGFRYFEVNELLSIFTTETGANPLLADTTFAVENDLFGFQLGYGAMIWQRGHFSMEAVGKAGVFYNDAETDVAFRSNANVTNDGADQSDDLAVGSEFRLMMSYQLPSGWSIRGGYQGVYLNDVALAGEQVATTGPVIFASPIFVQQNLGSVTYHGGFLGMEHSF